ncbi:hypothetical protein OCU04_001030 [Sclerotinia nivalis]|uniref:Uncharacterized protein n=1 Tax=Sclerotinia nivalis TaxID=352851 RepID=A0A9X0AXX5_9HELO|nr:hypothetical protein OCU04_001030 [Sclerotinia nivalis]
MEGSKFEGLFSEDALKRQVADYFAELDGEEIGNALSNIINNDGCKFTIPTYTDPIDFHLDETKMSRNNTKKMIAAITFMEDGGKRSFLKELCFACCIDPNTRGKKIRMDVRLEGRILFSKIKEWEAGDSDADSLGDDDGESLFVEEDGLEAMSDPALAYRVAVTAFEKMQVPQLQRVLHMICGGVYKYKFLTKKDYSKSHKRRDSDYTPRVLYINGTKVKLEHEAEACQAIERMGGSALKSVLKDLCSATHVSPMIGCNQLNIDGSTITLEIREWGKSDNENSKEGPKEKKSTDGEPEGQIKRDSREEVEDPSRDKSPSESSVPRKRDGREEVEELSRDKSPSEPSAPRKRRKT